MKKVWLYLIFICAAGLCLMMHVMVSGGISSYVEREVSFKFSQSPKCLYSFDAYSQGKDYDKLVIYKIDSDIERFEKHLCDENWHAFPLAHEVLNHPLCNLSFDVNMEEMLNCTNGYWYWNEKFNELMVYDAESHKIFIRKASVLSNRCTYNEDGLRVGENVVHLIQGSNNLHFFYAANRGPAVVEYNGASQ